MLIKFRCDSCPIPCELSYDDSQADEPNACPFSRTDHEWRLVNPECEYCDNEGLRNVGGTMEACPYCDGHSCKPLEEK